MPIAVESLLFLIAGVLLVVVLGQVFGWKRTPEQRNGGPGTPSVKLVRSPRSPQGREELVLTVNDRAILAANSEGLRPAEFAEQVEQLEAVATRMAAALRVPVEFARLGAARAGEEAGMPMGTFPRVSEEEIQQAEARLRAGSTGKGQAAG